MVVDFAGILGSILAVRSSRRIKPNQTSWAGGQRRRGGITSRIRKEGKGLLVKPGQGRSNHLGCLRFNAQSQKRANGLDVGLALTLPSPPGEGFWFGGAGWGERLQGLLVKPGQGRSNHLGCLRFNAQSQKRANGLDVGLALTLPSPPGEGFWFGGAGWGERLQGLLVKPGQGRSNQLGCLRFNAQSQKRANGLDVGLALTLPSPPGEGFWFGGAGWGERLQGLLVKPGQGRSNQLAYLAWGGRLNGAGSWL